MTEKTFIIFISYYFRILFYSFVVVTENLKLYNYMNLKSIALEYLSKNKKQVN